MANKYGIELKLTYGTWNCSVPKKCKSVVTALKQNIRRTMRNGFFDNFSRAMPVKVDAPFMRINTFEQEPFVKVELNEKHVKVCSVGSDLEINYDGPINVTMCWRIH